MRTALRALKLWTTQKLCLKLLLKLALGWESRGLFSQESSYLGQVLRCLGQVLRFLGQV